MIHYFSKVISLNKVLQKPSWRFIFPLFGLCLLAFQGMSQDITKKLSGNKWALTSYIQVEGMKFDTLFTALNCESEYILFNEDGTFKDTNLKKTLRFELADSIITFKKQSGIVHKKSRISILDENNLTLIDVNHGKGLFYIENYTRCTGKGGEIKDSRELIEIGTQTSVLVGLQQWETSFFEVGLSWMKKDWRKNALYKHVSLQINPSEDILGLNTSMLSQNFLIYGAGASVYTDFDKVSIGLQPIAGFTGKPLGGFGENIQLFYSFNFPFLGERIEEMSSSHITLRINFPVKKNTRQERRINTGKP